MKNLQHLFALVVLTVLLGCTPDTSADDQSKLATANEMVAAWNTMDWEQMFDLFADDGVLHSMMSEPIVGREEIRSRLSGLVGSIEQIELRIINMGIVNDVVVLERLDDFTINGNRSQVPVVGIMEIADGKVLEWREYYDKASLVNALIATEHAADVERSSALDVQAFLQALQDDWNSGDMQSYLDAYWDDEDLALVFGDRVISGRAAMTQLFTSAWPDEEKMGNFSTDNVISVSLSPDLVIVKGGFQHQFTNELVVGAFTHVIRRMDDGEWRIVHEHTSRKNPEN